MSFYANFGLHPTLEEYVQQIDSSAPGNILEWMFKKCKGPIPHAPIPTTITRQFRREVRRHYEGLPFWVQRECPRLIDASTEDGNIFYTWAALGVPGTIYWDALPDRTTRNLAAWLFGVRVLYAGYSFEDASRAVELTLFNGSVSSVGYAMRMGRAT